MELIIVATVLLASALVVLATTDEQKLAILLPLSVLQVYILPVAGTYISAATLLSCAALPRALYGTRHLAAPASILMLALLCVELASSGWSVTPQLALRAVIFQLPLLVTYLLALKCLRAQSFRVIPGVAAFSVCAAVQAFVVIVFRLSPALEEVFLKSGIARVLINPNSLRDLYSISPNNTIDPAKAGGFFPNANVAAAFLGISAFALLALRMNGFGGRWVAAISSLCWAAVFFTGSTMGMFLAVLMPVVYFALTRGRYPKSQTLLLGGFVVGGSVLQSLGYLELAADKTESTDSRLLIWQFAGDEFVRTPLLGHGYGGWQEVFPAFAVQQGLNETFPPHNSLIYTWSQIGLIGAGLSIAILGVFLTRSWRCAMRSGEVRALGSACLCAMLWLVLHSFVENYGLLGEEHIQPVLACVLAISAFYGSRSNEPTNSSDLPQPARTAL